jgi:16S rRNA (guanine527-N7)-methyltransferase
MMDNLINTEALFKKELLDMGIDLSDLQIQQFRSYFSMLLDWNQRMNLTNIVDPEGVYFKHFLDSISIAKILHDIRDGRMLDIGPGAGFPSIPVKICFPQLKITMVETLNKRVNFLNFVCEHLALSNIHAIHARIEDLGSDHNYRMQFDIVTARAVSKLSTLLEVSIPFLNQNGTFVAMKGPDIDVELRQADRAMKLLNAKLEKKIIFSLPLGLGERTIVTFARQKEVSSKYPRKQGLPFNKPL